MRYVYSLLSFLKPNRRKLFKIRLKKSLMIVHMLKRAVPTKLSGGDFLAQVLVGESLVKQDDPCAGIAKLFGEDISRKETSMA